MCRTFKVPEFREIVGNRREPVTFGIHDGKRRLIMPTKTSAEPYRLQPDPPEGDRQTIERELAKRDSAEDEPTEQGVELDPKRRID